MVTGTRDTLESPGEPGLAITHDIDPVAQKDENAGPGVGDKEGGDHVEEAVVRVTDRRASPLNLISLHSPPLQPRLLRSKSRAHHLLKSRGLEQTTSLQSIFWTWLQRKRRLR